MIQLLQAYKLYIWVFVTAFGMGSTWYLTSNYKEAQFTAAIEKQTAESAKLLNEHLTQNLKLTQQIHKLSSKLESEHAESLSKINQISRDNIKLSHELGGLRDPGNRKSSCSTSITTTDTTSHNTSPTSTSAYLSNEATEFLLDFSRQCDEVALYAQTCYEWTSKQPMLDELVK